MKEKMLYMFRTFVMFNLQLYAGFWTEIFVQSIFKFVEWTKAAWIWQIIIMIILFSVEIIIN